MKFIKTQKGLINTEFLRSVFPVEAIYTDDKATYMIDLAITSPEQGFRFKYESKEERDNDFNRMEKQIQSE